MIHRADLRLAGRALTATLLALAVTTASLSATDLQGKPRQPRSSEKSAPAPSAGLGPPPVATASLDPRFGIAEGFAKPTIMAAIGAGWERAVFSWVQIQPRGAGDFSGLGWTLPRALIEQELRRGVRLVGLLQFTPGWAAVNPSDGWRAVPKNLFLPADHPDNYFGRFVYETVKYYSGWVDEWILWNEPEFRPGDEGAGNSYSWLGSDEEFAQLLKVGYLAAKRANPNATISFPASSYWVEELAIPRRPQFYERMLALMAHDPEAAANDYYHDALSLNLYRNPDDVYRIHGVFKGIQHAYGLDKPIWLTETNAMPSDDRRVPCWERHAGDMYRTSMQEQAAYAVQAFALAAAAGYGRMGFYKMVDDNACQQEALWGVVRDDGSRRPVADALRTAVAHFAGYTQAQFAPLARAWARWPAWPGTPWSYTPNWQVYQVALDRPDGQRVTVLWNGDGTPRRVAIPRNGASATAVDALGSAYPLEADESSWIVELPGATAAFMVDDVVRDPLGYHYIGGSPVLIVEQGVDPATPVAPPGLL